MTEELLYPLRVEPIYQYRLSGGRRLAGLLTAPLPDGPIGEARVLSGREDHPSHVADGPPKGQQSRNCWNGTIPGTTFGKAGGAIPPIPVAPEIPRRA